MSDKAEPDSTSTVSEGAEDALTADSADPHIQTQTQIQDATQVVPRAHAQMRAHVASASGSLAQEPPRNAFGDYAYWGMGEAMSEAMIERDGEAEISSATGFDAAAYADAQNTAGSPVPANADAAPNPEDEDQNWIHGDLDEDDDEIDDNVNDTSSVAFLRREEKRNAPEPTAAQVVRNNFTVIAAIVAGVSVAFVKFLASAFTGSVAMFSEGIHSLVDACNDSLLLIGTRASKKKPDVEHPFGFGRELYFYTFVVSVVIFFFGGGYTIVQGVTSFLAGGNVVADPLVDYVVLLIGIVLEGFSFSVAWRDVKRARQGRSLVEYIRDSKSPTNFMVLLEDTAAELGMIIALLGISLSLALDMPRLDSLASIVIGLLMAFVAVVLLRETRSLLIGEGLTREEIEDVVFIVEQDPAVIKCGRVLSMYMGPADMLLNLDVTFDDELDEGDVLQAIDRIEAELIDDYPQCSSIFIEAESLNQVYRQRHDRRQAFEAEEEDEEEREREKEREREIERELARLKAEKKKAKKKAEKQKAKAKAKKRAAEHAAAMAGVAAAAARHANAGAQVPQDAGVEERDTQPEQAQDSDRQRDRHPLQAQAGGNQADLAREQGRQQVDQQQ